MTKLTKLLPVAAQDQEPPDGPGPNQLTLDRAFMRMVSAMASLEEAKAQLASYVDARHLSEHGDELAELAILIDQAQRDHDSAKAELKRLQVAVEDEPPVIGTPSQNGVRFFKWMARDQIEAPVLVLALLFALVASIVTTQANLAASYLPVFIEQPLLSWLMASIPALGAVLIKVVVMSPRLHRVQDLLSLVLYMASSALLATWVFLFADQFNGASGGFDPFADSGSDKGASLVAVQLFAEMLIGAALYVRFATILKRYAPDGCDRNLKRDDLIELRNGAQLAVAAKATVLAELEGRQALLDGRKAEALETATTALKLQFARFGDLPF